MRKFAIAVLLLVLVFSGNATASVTVSHTEVAAGTTSVKPLSKDLISLSDNQANHVDQELSNSLRTPGKLSSGGQISTSNNGYTRLSKTHGLHFTRLADQDELNDVLSCLAGD